ncbi:uncharacterized protein LOC116160424 [Photinus pyralis]|nr:uncharacterized protein LOC116160424 [Photinus pyralis]
MLLLLHIILLFSIRRPFSRGNENASLTNLELCKVSHYGLEYRGFQGKSESGVRCQLWETDNPVHAVDKNLTDDKFPENSRALAKNYCRNPSKDPKGPWCYTMDRSLINETCGVLLCRYLECRITGPGMEYAGSHNRGSSERKCLKWNKSRQKVKYKNTYISIDKFTKDRFPEGSLSDAKKYCRNPDGDFGGPWCFIEHAETNEIEREYCDIPFCDVYESFTFSKDDSVYSHYHTFNHTFSNLTFGIKLWDSDDYNLASARLVLSLYALPLNRKELKDSEIGIEIFVSNREVGLTIGSRGKVELEPSIGIIKSATFTFLSLTWSSGYITLSYEGKTTSLFINEFKTKGNLLGYLKDQFYFYSFQGTNILWNFPFDNADAICNVHTTTALAYQHFFPLRVTDTGHELRFTVRAAHSAHILLVTNPPTNFPRIELMLSKLDNVTRVVSTEYENGPRTVLKEAIFPSILSYWKWNDFSLMLFSDSLHVYWTRSVGERMIMDVKHETIKKLRWYSPSSANNVAHWTFYCKPPPSANPPNAWPPECALYKHEPDYKGTQTVTSEGLPCIPWLSRRLLPKLEDLLSKSDQNYCRNPTNDPQGTYCYVINQSGNKAVQKKYCNIRRCKSAECKVAGTGNDYIGKLNKTRSRRTCRNWINALSNNGRFSEYLNDTLFTDMTVKDADNFCRNPTRSIAGSWCFTTDANIERDVCNVRDCSKSEKCIILLREYDKGRNLYILPQWKETGPDGGLFFSLKQWNPDNLGGMAIEITSKDGRQHLRLFIGTQGNDKLVLYYGTTLLKHFTVPRIIPSGRWASFWLQVRKGEVLLGYEGLTDAIFEWRDPESIYAFEPFFLNYQSLEGFPIGISFKCDSCHTEVTDSTLNSSKILPIGLWSQEEDVLNNNLTINIRGFGTLSVRFFTFPDSDSYHSLVFDNTRKTLSFIEHTKDFHSHFVNHTLYTDSTWTKVVVLFSEKAITVLINSTATMSYTTNSGLLIYWFTVVVKNGAITWTANCNPPDIDGKPLDGGWSHWSAWHCTVTCGGGEGYRTRTCTNPSPNIFGKLCEGPSVSTGICNDFECGDISLETMEKIRENLRTMHFSFVITENSGLTIENDHELLNVISAQSPEAYYEWTWNGLPLKFDEERLKFKDDNIIIQNANVGDTGVYVCMLYRVNKQKLVLRVASLSVLTSNYLISTRATLDLTLHSNAVVLGYVYSDLRQKWLLNDSMYLDYGITTLSAVNVERLKDINQSHSGLWKCIVEQRDLKLQWTTNVLKVEVKSAPNIYTYLREDKLTSPIFSWFESDEQVKAALITTVVIVCLCVLCGVYIYFKFCTLPSKPKVNKKRNRRFHK